MEIIDRIVMLLNEKGVEQKALAEHVSYKMRNENAKQKAGAVAPAYVLLMRHYLILLSLYLQALARRPQSWLVSRPQHRQCPLQCL